LPSSFSINEIKASAIISGEYLPILPSFSRDSRALLNEIFCNLNSSTTILGVTINGTLKNLAALIALPSSVANSDLSYLPNEMRSLFHRGGSKNSKFKTKNYQIVNIRGETCPLFV